MTSGADGFIRAVLVMPFVQHVETLGLNPNPALKAMGLDPKVLRDPEATVHAEIIYGLCNELANLSDNPYLGCHIGEQFDLTRWPLVAVAAQNSRTIADFLCNYIMRVPQESSSVRHAMKIEADRTLYSIKRLAHTRNPPKQVDGFGAGIHLRLMEMSVGTRWEPDKVLITTTFPEVFPRGYKGVGIAKTNDRELGLSFPTKWLGAPFELNIAKENGTPTTEPNLSIIAALRSAARPLLLNPTVSSKELSEALCLEVKSLEAALRLHKTTVAREVKGLRIELAKDALLNSSLTVAKIGQSLGYEDQSHFARFFRSQTNLSPQQFRERSGKDTGK